MPAAGSHELKPTQVGGGRGFFLDPTSRGPASLRIPPEVLSAGGVDWDAPLAYTACVATTLGGEIRRLRLEADITLRAFAEQLGHTAAHQSDIEHGRRMPSERVLRKIAERLAHVGATYEGLREFDPRLGPELEQLVKDNPEARALLRATDERARASGRSVREILRELQRKLREEDEGERQVKSWPDRSGRFGVRLYFEAHEFEEMMDDLRARAGTDVFKEGSGIDIDLVLLRAFGLEADYVDLPADVLGRTVFDRMGNARVELNRDLDRAASSDDLAQRRLRTTLAHEVGHVACHSTLFIEDTKTMSLFPEDGSRGQEGILCREASVGTHGEYEDRRYRGEWWEYQANQCMAAVLLPRELFREKANGAVESMGAKSFKEALLRGSGEKVLRLLADCFNVSQEAVFYRMQELGYAGRELQLSL